MFKIKWDVLYRIFLFVGKNIKDLKYYHSFKEPSSQCLAVFYNTTSFLNHTTISKILFLQ